MLSIGRCPRCSSAVWCTKLVMEILYIFLICLLTTQAAPSWKSKRGSRYAVREASHDGGSGYQYQAPATGGESSSDHQQQTEGQGDGGYHYDAPSSGSMSAAMMSHHEAMQDFGGGGVGVEIAMSQGSHQGSGGASAGFQEIGNFAAHADAVLGMSDNNAGGHGASGHQAGTGDYDFNSVLNSVNSASFGSGSSDQFMAVQGEVIDERPPSVFHYKPHFGGKDINNLPHILPPGGKSVQELQDEADAKLRAIISKARMNQMEVVERIAKLKTNYGFGTLGYDGFKDTRFKKMGKIDLGTHKAIDLGTSIDYNALKGSDGKLKLPIQNIYHTKTLGIHIPKPYPIKHEVAVPAPYPVPHPYPVQNHKPKLYSPLSQGDIAQLSADDGRGSYGSFPPYGGSDGSAHSNFNFGGNDGSAHSNFNFGGDDHSNFNFEEQNFKGSAGNSFSVEPSQRVSESSSVGGLPYGAGTPNAAQSISSDSGHGDFSNMAHGQSLPLSTFGLPPGTVSGALSSYDVPLQGHGQTIQSEAGQVQIPAMMHHEAGKPNNEYGPPH